MKNKFVIIIALLVLAGVIAVLMMNNNEGEETVDENQPVTGDPMDTASAFYNEWLDAVESTSTDPYQAGLASDERLTQLVQDYIIENQTNQETGDPVLCQLEAPPRIGAKFVYEDENDAQLMMLPRGLEGETSKYAMVDVEGIDGEWRITNIVCVNGESAPEREYTFEKPGFLLKSGESGLDPDVWHLVFEENGVQGHTAPQFFSENSICITPDGTESVCNPDEFTNPSEVIVKGEMTESGVDVRRVEFVN